MTQASSEEDPADSESVLEDQSPISRRCVLSFAAVLTGGGAASAMGVQAFSRSAVAVSTAAPEDWFTADSVTIVSNAGEVEDITVQPDLDVDWDGLNSHPNRIEFTIKSNSSSGGPVDSTLGSETLGSPEQVLDGSDTYTFTNSLSLLAESGWSETDFETSDNDGDDDDGSGSTTTDGVTVEVVAELHNDDAGSPYTDTVSGMFSVAVSEHDGDDDD